MVCDCKEKPEGKLRQRYSDEKLNETIGKIQRKECSIRKAECESRIPTTTLLQYLKELRTSLSQ